jgi:hypothetical protein
VIADRGLEGHVDDAWAQRLRKNEEIKEALNRRFEGTLDEIRERDGLEPEAPMALFCECSDLGCRERIHIVPRRFDELHRDADQFVVMPGHEMLDIERVVDQEGDYLIVRKIV